MKRLFFTLILVSFALNSLAQDNPYGNFTPPAKEAKFPKVTAQTHRVEVQPDYMNSKLGVVTATDFSDGIAFYKDPKSGLWGMINYSGRVIIEATLKLNTSYNTPAFYNDVCMINAQDGEAGYWLINKQGETIKKLPHITQFSGFASGAGGVIYSEIDPANGYINSSRKWSGYIDTTGEFIYKNLHQRASGWSRAPVVIDFDDCNNLCAYYDEEARRWGYFNRVGEMVIKPQFEQAKNFSDNRAAVFIDGVWRFIETTGEMAFDRSFETNPQNFSCGYALVFDREDSEYDYINREGVTQFSASRASSFTENGFATIIENSKTKIINTDFQVLKELGNMRITSDYNASRENFMTKESSWILSPTGWAYDFMTTPSLSVVFKAHTIRGFGDDARCFVYSEEQDEETKEIKKTCGYTDLSGSFVIIFVAE